MDLENREFLSSDLAGERMSAYDAAGQVKALMGMAMIRWILAIGAAAFVAERVAAVRMMLGTEECLSGAAHPLGRPARASLYQYVNLSSRVMLPSD